MGRGQRQRRQQLAVPTSLTEQQNGTAVEKQDDSPRKDITSLACKFYFHPNKTDEEMKLKQQKKILLRSPRKSKKECPKPDKRVVESECSSAFLECDQNSDGYWYYDARSTGYFYENKSGMGWRRRKWCKEDLVKAEEERIYQSNWNKPEEIQMNWNPDETFSQSTEVETILSSEQSSWEDELTPSNCTFDEDDEGGQATPRPCSSKESLDATIREFSSAIRIPITPMETGDEASPCDSMFDTSLSCSPSLSQLSEDSIQSTLSTIHQPISLVSCFDRLAIETTSRRLLDQLLSSPWTSNYNFYNSIATSTMTKQEPVQCVDEEAHNLAQKVLSTACFWE